MSKCKSKQKISEQVAELYKKFPKENATIKIKDVKLWEDNPNDDYSTVPGLAELFRKYGQISPIVVWRKNMTVYKGNHTLLAMKENCQKLIDAIIVDFPSRAMAELYGMADNNAGRLSVLNEEAMVKLLKAERITSFANEDDLQILSGFSEKKFKALLLSTEDMPDKLPDVEIQGLTENGDAPRMVILFDSESELMEFRKLIKLEEVAHRRVFPFSAIKPYLQEKSIENKKKRSKRAPF